ncbi:uncharacterized protein LOC123261669 isoform X1 [Cotesia glomerata]|uniref:Hemolymph juvenile hormone binding protein n=1 Tax=Cotesia glomerata TaxID=32391 RepID=A0AAV7HYZ8_COTGL|nr:uncharacterized protein LOC123261669 isoform X1 [Cotesia glomerata]KAH0550444.1 hypothetical protein KQX54_019419 [Cotesia glomerata]
MKFPAIRRMVFLVVSATIGSCPTASSSPRSPGPGFLLDGISNVATSASNFLTGVVQRQKELLHHVTDTATDYVSNAVEKPRNLLMNTAIMTTNYIDSAASIGLDFKLRRLLEKFRSRMPYGFPELDVPVLEPLQLHEIYVETHNPEIGDLNIFVDNVTISGLSTFVVDRARLSLLGPTIAVNLTIPTVIVDGYYNISGILGDTFELHGSGPFAATARDFKVFFMTVLGYSRGMYLKSFDLDFSIRDVKIRMANFMGNSKYSSVMNEVFQELTPQGIEIIKPEILPDIQDFIAARVNDTIYHLTMRDVLTFLIGENEIRNNPHLLQP